MEKKNFFTRLDPRDLPPEFVYPVSFEQHIAKQSVSDEALEPWGFVADVDANLRYAQEYGGPVVKFAQAWHEDLIACFIVGTGPDPAVVVLNPWADELVDGEWKKVCHVVVELPTFTAWLEWVLSSELVTTYAQVRAERG